MTSQHLSMPKRDQLVLEKLQTAGFLDHAQTDFIKRAIARSGQGDKALGFATAYLAMIAGAVPVNAVIDMAEKLETRINLTWSKTRWQTEHDRLSRLMTLKRLADANVTYDLSAIDALIPEAVRHRLIRTSRRLGLEGLRQRHCVANYHELCQSGTCAIASVIDFGRRWTVELRAFAGTLRILQIRGPFNAIPTDAQVWTIRARFGVDGTQSQPAAMRIETQRSEDALIREAAPIFAALRAEGIVQVEVYFDGSGDSGSICDIQYIPHLPSDTLQVRCTQPRRVFENGTWVSVLEQVEKPVNSAIDALVYDFLEITRVDWYNDDGGFGHVIIDLNEETLRCEVNTRFTTSEPAYCEAFDTVTGQSVDP